MEKILISACLIGDKCRYDGKDNLHPLIDKLLEKFELVPFCPEVEGGLKTPRDPSERNKLGVKMKSGRNVTPNFYRGADLAVNICLHLNIKVAILKERSPSCGVKKIHDGSFTGKLIKGQGVTTEVLRSKGIRVISEEEIEEFLNEITEG